MMTKPPPFASESARLWGSPPKNKHDVGGVLLIADAARHVAVTYIGEDKKLLHYVCATKDQVPMM